MCGLGLERSDQRLRDARLADAGLSGQQDHLPLAGLCLAPALEEQRQFLVAADDRLHRGARMCCEPALQHPFAEHGEGPHRLIDALQIERPEIVEFEIVADQASGEVGNHHLAGPGCCLEAGSDVRRLSDDGLFLGGSGADEIAHYDQSRRDADPAGERRAAARQRCHSLADRQSGSHGPLGFILMRPGPAEIGEHSVAHEFRDVAFERRDFAGHCVLVGAKQLPHLFGIEAAGERGRSHEIDEHHGELPAFRAGRRAPSPGPAQGRRRAASAQPSARRGAQQPLSMPE